MLSYKLNRMEVRRQFNLRIDPSFLLDDYPSPFANSPFLYFRPRDK